MTAKSRKITKKSLGTAYQLPSEATKELQKIMKYNDSCAFPYKRVHRSDVITLLKQYGWQGSSAASLNRLIYAHFGRSFTKVSTKNTGASKNA